MWDKYVDKKLVGMGAYGSVYSAKERATGRYVAIKETELDHDGGVPATTLREISVLKLLNRDPHPNIVRLLNVEEATSEDGESTLCLVFEVLDCDLRKFMDTMRREKRLARLPSSDVKNLLYQILRGVSHCHARGVMHRDLKPHNILVDRGRGILKVADFGLGRHLEHGKYTRQMITLWYRAPEVLLGSDDYSAPVDVWAVGCIFVELCTFQAPFRGNSDIEQTMEIFRTLGTPNEVVWPGVTRMWGWHIYPQWKGHDWAELVPCLDSNGLDLLRKMMTYDPEKRISARRALRHPYFNDLDRDAVPEYGQWL